MMDSYIALLSLMVGNHIVVQSSFSFFSAKISSHQTSNKLKLIISSSVIALIIVILLVGVVCHCYKSWQKSSTNTQVQDVEQKLDVDSKEIKRKLVKILFP